MSVNLYNSEGYFDPTAYAALSRIEQEAKSTAFKPLVFICSPFAGDRQRNAERARKKLTKNAPTVAEMFEAEAAEAEAKAGAEDGAEAEAATKAGAV